ncbi:hypothetical protein L7F22_023670, partial [Adiantum nelumboides]|nr:hypothetical protein [Adiantum nelumboides]
MSSSLEAKIPREESKQALLSECLLDDVLRAAAYATQYVDEHDDSFDDLGT